MQKIALESGNTEEVMNQLELAQEAIGKAAQKEVNNLDKE
jgi:hypothetical protein